MVAVAGAASVFHFRWVHRDVLDQYSLLLFLLRVLIQIWYYCSLHLTLIFDFFTIILIRYLNIYGYDWAPSAMVVLALLLTLLDCLELIRHLHLLLFGLQRQISVVLRIAMFDCWFLIIQKQVGILLRHFVAVLEVALLLRRRLTRYNGRFIQYEVRTIFRCLDPPALPKASIITMSILNPLHMKWILILVGMHGCVYECPLLEVLRNFLPQLRDKLALLYLVRHLLWLKIRKTIALPKGIPLLQLD